MRVGDENGKMQAWEGRGQGERAGKELKEYY